MNGRLRIAMIDSILLGSVRRGSESALCQIIDKYAAFVCTVIRNAVRESLTHEDVEETASDVFFALWENAGSVNKLKPWLGATARNKAINKLREVRTDLPLDDEILLDSGSEHEMENSVIAGFERSSVKAAVLALGGIDCEIFLRHYYESQTVATIAAETGMTEAAVKQRLVRGRKKLGIRLLEKGAFENEDGKHCKRFAE